MKSPVALFTLACRSPWGSCFHKHRLCDAVSALPSNCFVSQCSGGTSV